MNKGKNICKLLKAIRKRIADENGITYNPHECKFMGDCKGTCPACEAETKWLEQELSVRKTSGFPLKIAGIAIALCSTSTFAQTETHGNNICQTDTLKTVDLAFGAADTIKISGTVVDENNAPLIGTMINIIPKKGETHRTITSIDGAFSIIIPRDSKIEFEYIGCESKTLKACELQKNNKVTLKQSLQGLQGEIIVTDNRNKNDDVYNRNH